MPARRRTFSDALGCSLSDAGAGYAGPCGPYAQAKFRHPSLKRRRTESLNNRFDRMIQDVNLVQRSATSPKTQDNSTPSIISSSSTASQDIPRTPIDSFFSTHQPNLGQGFTPLKLHPSSRLQAPAVSEHTSGYMRPQTISPIPHWLVNTLNSLDVHHPLRALLPEHEIHTATEVLRPQFTAKLTTSHRQNNNEDDIFAFRPPTAQAPLPGKVALAQSISNMDTITDGEQTTYISQHNELGLFGDNESQVDLCAVGEDLGLQLLTKADDPVPFSRPGPHVITKSYLPGDLHPHMSVAPHNDVTDNRYDLLLSSSPLSNTPGKHSPTTSPKEADGLWAGAPDGSLDYNSLLSPLFSPHRFDISPSRVASNDLAYYDPTPRPDYECDLDYSSLDFKWEKFPRNGLIALSPRDEELDTSEFIEEAQTAEETRNEVVLLASGTSSEAPPPLLGLSSIEIGEGPVTPIRKTCHAQAGAPIQSAHEITLRSTADTQTKVSVLTAATDPFTEMHTSRPIQDQEDQLDVQHTSHQNSSNTTSDVHSAKGSSDSVHESSESEVVDEFSSSQLSDDTIESWSNV